MTMKSIAAMLAVLVTLGLASVSVQASSLGIAETTELCQTDGSASYCRVIDQSDDDDDDDVGHRQPARRRRGRRLEAAG